MLSYCFEPQQKLCPPPDWGVLSQGQDGKHLHLDLNVHAFISILEKSVLLCLSCLTQVNCMYGVFFF